MEWLFQAINMDKITKEMSIGEEEVQTIITQQRLEG